MQSWEQRITTRNLRLVDRFLNLQIHILVDFVVKDTGERWIACSDCKSTGGKPIILHNTVLIKGEKRPVLIDVVQSVDFPKNFIPTFVRFEPVDSFYSFGPHTLYFSSLLGFVSSGILCNREFDSTRRRIACHGDQMICQVIECCSEILDNISGSTKRIKTKDSDGLNIWQSSLERCQFCITENNMYLLVPKDDDFPRKRTLSPS